MLAMLQGSIGKAHVLPILLVVHHCLDFIHSYDILRIVLMHEKGLEESHVKLHELTLQESELLLLCGVSTWC